MTSRPNVDSAQFRELCGRFATGVVVVTTLRADGTPAGMTANSFTSVSLDPPLVSVSVDRTADMHEILKTVPRFLLNILAHRQEELSRRFAAPIPSRFDGIGFAMNPRGLPVLSDTLATIECERHTDFAVGDHTIVIGRVVGGQVGDGRPLLYYRGGYQDMGAGGA